MVGHLLLSITKRRWKLSTRIYFRIRSEDSQSLRAASICCYSWMRTIIIHVIVSLSNFYNFSSFSSTATVWLHVYESVHIHTVERASCLDWTWTYPHCCLLSNLSSTVPSLQTAQTADRSESTSYTYSRPSNLQHSSTICTPVCFILCKLKRKLQNVTDRSNIPA